MMGLQFLITLIDAENPVARMTSCAIINPGGSGRDCHRYRSSSGTGPPKEPRVGPLFNVALLSSPNFCNCSTMASPHNIPTIKLNDGSLMPVVRGHLHLMLSVFLL
jgi:hypothetical protein